MDTFRVDGEITATHAEERVDGGVLQIECQRGDGSDTVLRLEFTFDGIDRFQEVVAKFVHACLEARAEAGAPRTAATEPTSAGAKDVEQRHVRRYFVARMPDSDLQRLLSAIRPYCSEPPPAGFDGPDRVVTWRASARATEGPGDADYHVYLSAGAARAARQEGTPVVPLGEVSWHDLPKERELLIGDPPLDWQDTSYFNSEL